MRWLAALGLALAGWLAPGLGQVASAQTTTTCYPADTKGVDGPVDYGAYCWIDFTPLNLTSAKSSAGQPFRVDLRGGAYLTFTLRITNQTPAGAVMEAVAVPSWSGAAFGNSAFIDIPGRPILYQDRNNQSGPRNTVTLSGLTLHANGATELPFVFVAADGESSNSGETLSFTTTGDPWALVSAPGESNPARNMPVLNPPTTVGNSTGSQVVTITGTNGGPDGEGSYVFTTNNSPGTVTTVLQGGGLQGALFGLKYHTIGLSLTKSHVGQFKAGGTGIYTLETANTVVTPQINPPTEPQPVRVVDTLPVGLTYTSANGGGFWTCSNVGQVVTCDAIALQDLTVSRTFPPITLNVNVASDAPASVTNTAEISDPTTSTLVFNVCEVPGNGVCPGSATSTDGDVTAILHSDLSTSTKTVVDRNGGDANPGDVLEYTITLVESAGVAAGNVSVTDDMPANVGNLTVTSKPAGITDNSSASGGANGTGRIDMTGISIPASGSVTIVYRVTIAAGTTPGTQLQNSANVVNGDPLGTGATPSAPPVTVSPSAMPSSGNKQLYLLTGPVGGNLDLTRTRPGTNGTMTWANSGGQQYQYFRLPPLAANLVLNSANVSVQLRGRRSGTSGTRRLRARLYLNGTGAGNAISGDSADMNFNVTGYTTRTVGLTLSQTSFSAGDQIILRVQNRDNRNVELTQRDGSNYSFVTLDAATVVNVDSIGFFSAQHPSTAQKTEWEPGDTVYIRADISDPFGGFDVSAANSRLSLADADGGPLILNNVALTPRTNPTEGNGVANRILEYAYTLPSSPSFGTWTATVTGSEGLENTITHSRNASFEVVPKALEITKSHTGNFIAGSNNSYTLTVGNTGGAIAAGTTTTVLDTLAPGLTFVSGTGTGWTCSAAGQDVTCTSTAAIPGGGTMAPITLTVLVDGSVGTSVDNQASVGNSSIGGGFQKPGNVDTATVLHPDLSTSTKSVADPNGGDVAPGDVLRYTITLTESAGATAGNVSVTDPLPANTTNLALVSLPPGSIDASSPTQLSVSGITVPANSSVQVVFDVTVGSVAAGTTIDNTATITNPGGPAGNPVAPTVVVLQSEIIEPASGNKVLYLYDDGTMSRVRTAPPATAGRAASGTTDWTLTPALAKDLRISAGTAVVNLRLSSNCTFACQWLSPSITVGLFHGATQIGNTSAPQTITNTSPATASFTISIPAAADVPAGDQIVLRVTAAGVFGVQVYQYEGGRSTVSFATTTVINVDGMGVYSAPYPSVATSPQFVQGDTMYLRAEVSDPFGSADINRAELTLTDAGSTALKSSEVMPQVDATAATKVFETAYLVPANPRIGNWIASVVAVEGEELDGGGQPAITHEGIAYAIVHGLVTLTKAWSGATDGHAVDLAVSGGSNGTAGNSVAPATTTPATATAGPGATLTLSESFTNGSPVSYAKALSCTKASDSSAVAVTGTGSSRTITMPDDSAVACVWSNTWMVPLTVVKLNAVAWDPVNEFSNPKAIPGALVEYHIIVTNPSAGEVDADTVFVTDALPDHVALRLEFDTPGSGPVSFTDGSTPSGLTYAFVSLGSGSDDIEFSNDGGATWTYVPVADADGFDAAVDAIRVNPKGAFAGGGGQFTVKFRVRVE